MAALSQGGDDGEPRGVQQARRGAATLTEVQTNAANLRVTELGSPAAGSVTWKRFPRWPPCQLRGGDRPRHHRVDRSQTEPRGHANTCMWTRNPLPAPRFAPSLKATPSSSLGVTVTPAPPHAAAFKEEVYSPALGCQAAPGGLTVSSEEDMWTQRTPEPTAHRGARAHRGAPGGCSGKAPSASEASTATRDSSLGP